METSSRLHPWSQSHDDRRAGNEQGQKAAVAGEPDRGGPVPGTHGWRSLSSHELRARQLRILDAIDRHCREFGITYYLCAGSLLGAIRHGGYIPWDDDIDIMLPRQDYEQFCRTFGRADGDVVYSLRSLETSPTYPFPFAKVCDDETRLDVGSDVVRDIGVYVDVFPIDAWCDGRIRGWLQRQALGLLCLAMRAKHLQTKTARNLFRKVVLSMAKLGARPVGARYIARALTLIATLSRQRHPRASGVIVWGYRERVPTHCYGSPQPIVFEGRKYPSPKDSETVLKIIYGDYMSLPPLDQRTTHHRFSAYAMIKD